MINKILILFATLMILTNYTNVATIIRLTLTIKISISLTLKMLIKLRSCGVLFLSTSS